MAWVEFLRDTGSAACVELDRLLSRRVAVTDPIVMEVLAGARDDQHLRALQGLLGRARLVTTISSDYVTAASIHRSCRAHGETVPRPVDCLIAAVAMRTGLPLLHQDADFDTIARHSSLRIHQSPTAVRPP